jgi:1-acyl-sn-glycerol-3-phosphate acyltransferase
LYWRKGRIELKQGLHTGFLPAGFGVDEQTIHVEDNCIQTHRGAKLVRCVDYSVISPERADARKDYTMTIRERLKRLRLVRKVVYAIVGMVSYPGLTIVNRLKISGTEHLRRLPRQNVLFVSNHQTYFADVITFLHIFCAVKWGKKNRLGLPYYLLNPFTNVYYVAAEETMRATWVSRLFTMAGALTVKRTWNNASNEVRRGLDPSDTRKIFRALDSSWVITFPQGTTKAFAPGRKGTAHIIKQNRPVVVPVVIGGFWRAFDKKGLKFKKKGVELSVTIKEPLVIDYDAPPEAILDQVMDAIEQSKKFMMQGAHHWSKAPIDQ